MRGYYGIGIYHTKTEVNVGTLWRSAAQLGASFVFTIGRRYRKQASDVHKAWRHIPLHHYADFGDFYSHLPYDCRLVGVEMGGEELRSYAHPQRAVYLLGAEDKGLPHEIIGRCHDVVSIEAINLASYNVAVAGSLVMYDRMVRDG